MKLRSLNPQEHAAQRWKPHTNLAFARERGLVEVDATELGKVACQMPIAFLPVEGERWAPVALLGLDGTSNLYVAADGSWLAPYIPARLRAAPFAIATNERGERVLCLDDSFVPADDGEGLPFFGSSGLPSEALTEARDFLSTLESQRAVTLKATAALRQAGVLQPWAATVQIGASRVQLAGLHCVDEDVLNRLAASDFAALRDVGALVVAYCALISMQHLAHLGRLAEAHAQLSASQARAATALQKGDELDLSFMANTGTLALGG